MTLHAPHTPLFSMLIACGIATATFAATIPVQADDVPAWLVVVKEDATMQVSPKAGPPVTAALLPGEIVKVREAKPEGYLVLREERSGKKTLGLIAKEAVAVPDQGLQWINTQLQKDAARADLLPSSCCSANSDLVQSWAIWLRVRWLGRNCWALSAMPRKQCR